MSVIKMSAFRWVPPFARGLVRDLRVRWALEEAGLPYDELLLGQGDNQSEGYLKMQPFGQVPAYQEDGLVMFESGAVVLHIAERSTALLPTEPAARARATSWMFAALNTVEPPIMALIQFDLRFGNDEAARPQRQYLAEAVQRRLDSLAAWLGEREHLEDRFTAGDLLMVTVLRILRTTDMVAAMPVLAAYQARCEARPAFQKALAAQMGAFADAAD